VVLGDSQTAAPEGAVYAADEAELRARAFDLAHPADGGGNVPILAGPLTTVTRHLLGIGTRLVGLSWGWDLQPEAIGEPFVPADLAWIAGLDALIVDSDVTRNVALGLGLEQGRIATIPWGVDVDLFTPDGPVADLSCWGVGAQDIVVLSLRAHTAIHGTTDVIEALGLALAEQPRLFLLMGGHGPLTEQHQARVRELAIEDRVRFIGLLPETELPTLLRAVDMYVSMTQVDGTSVTLLQALACGTPVVASDIPGNRPWIDLAGAARCHVGDTVALGAAFAGRPGTRPSAKVRGGLNAAAVKRVDWHANSQALTRILLVPLTAAVE
jgi:glycosyltransferase involved in cell wall biosynthesis